MTIIKSLIACDRKNINLSISILLNCSKEDTEDIKTLHVNTLEEIEKFSNEHGLGDIIQIESREFEPKFAGVGLARKTLMDAASNRFRDDQINGIVTALDADCTIEPNYLQSLSQFFKETKAEAVSIYYEHPIQNNDACIPIIEYEYHLRYFISMQRLVNFPFAIHTVGSSMACLSESYLKKGGMNKRKAGEDFYFLHKFIKDGVCGEVGNTTVYPDGRISDRVPFGTGRAIGKYEELGYLAMTYNPASFIELQRITLHVGQWYTSEVNLEHLDPILREYLQNIDFEKKVSSIRKHVSNINAFKKRFYQYFDAFQLMKALHYMREHYPDVQIEVAAKYFHKEILKISFTNMYDALLQIRTYERSIYLN